MLLPVQLSLYLHRRMPLILLSSALYPFMCHDGMRYSTLCSTPRQLLSTVEVILAAYERSAGSASLLGQAGMLMYPEVIVRMRNIQEDIRKDL